MKVNCSEQRLASISHEKPVLAISLWSRYAPSNPLSELFPAPRQGHVLNCGCVKSELRPVLINKVSNRIMPPAMTGAKQTLRHPASALMPSPASTPVRFRQTARHASTHFCYPWALRCLCRRASGIELSPLLLVIGTLFPSAFGPDSAVLVPVFPVVWGCSTDSAFFSPPAWLWN